MIALKILAMPLLLVMLPADLLSAERLRVAVSNYNLSSLSMGVAHSRGFFKEEGFDSEVIRMNPNVATTAAVTGDVDFSALIGSLIGAAIKGAPLKLVACSQDRTPIVFVARPSIKSVKELRGKTIGIPSYGSTPDVVGRMVLKHFGVDPDKGDQSDRSAHRCGPAGRPQGRDGRCHRGRAADRLRGQEIGLQRVGARRRYFYVSLQRPGNEPAQDQRAPRPSESEPFAR